MIRVTDTLPTAACVNANAHALARYAWLGQQQGLVPIVEPEVLMDGLPAIERCEEVTAPAAVPGIVFLSEGQQTSLATTHLNTINRLASPKPWKVGFSYGRAFSGSGAGGMAWPRREPGGGPAGLLPPAACIGKYTDQMEAASPSSDDRPPRRDD